jgi:hypothetical protein
MNGMVATLLVLIGMVAMGGAGYGLGRFVLATKLQPSEVHDSRPTPIRILTPDEAKAVARDEDSPVWTEGVKDEDIPKVESVPGTDRPRRRRARPAESAPTTTSPTTPTPAVETPAPPAETPEPAPTPPANTDAIPDD